MWQVAGVTVTAEDINVVRTFKGDSAKYMAAVSRDGSLTVIMNVVQDDELRAMVRRSRLPAPVSGATPSRRLLAFQCLPLVAVARTAHRP